MPLFGPPDIEYLKKRGRVKALIKALDYTKDPEWNIRRNAAKALGELGDERAAMPLISILDEVIQPANKYYLPSRNRLREVVVEALGEIGNAESIGPLIKTLDDKYECVRRAGERALLKIGPRAVSTLINHLFHVSGNLRISIYYLLKGIGTPSVKPLTEKLTDKNEDVREIAAIALGYICDSSAIQPLIATLTDQSKKVRQGVVVAMSKIGGSQAVEALIPLLKDEDEKMRSSVVEALGSIGDSRAVEPLVTALTDTNRKLCFKTVLGSLGKINDPQAVNSLTPFLLDEDEKLRVVAAESLGNIGDSCAIEHLITALEYKKAREAAAKALSTIGEPAINPLIAALNKQQSRQYAIKALAGIGKPAVQPLIKLFGNMDKTLREAAVDALLRIDATLPANESDIVYSAVGQVLNSKESYVREAADKVQKGSIDNTMRRDQFT